MGFRRRFNLNNMKKLIFILLFFSCSFAKAQYATGTIASRQFKDLKVWSYREDLRTAFSYTMTQQELVALLRLWKNLQGHADWEYTTYNVDTTFTVLFPYSSATSSDAALTRFVQVSHNIKYPITLRDYGSPTLSKSGYTYNGTTQSTIFQYFRTWDGTTQNLTTTLLMDTVMGKSATDTVANTQLNLAIYMKDSADNARFGSFTGTNGMRVISNNLNYLSSMYNETVGQGRLNGTVKTNRSGLYVTARQQLTHKNYFRGVVQDSSINASYNFSLARNTNSVIEVQAISSASVFSSGTVSFLAILNRAYNALEQDFFSKAVTNYVNFKAQ